MLNKYLGALALTLPLFSIPASATPLVYNCEIFDYRSTGVERTEFQYADVGEGVAYHSNHSTARIYLNGDHRLVISLRPRGTVPGLSFYSSVTGYDLPHRLGVVLTNGQAEAGYAARLACRL